MRHLSFFLPDGDPEIMAPVTLAWFLSPTGRKAAEQFDALYLPIASAPFKGELQEAFGKPVLDHDDLMPLWSAAEMAFREEAYAAAASLATYLNDLAVEGQSLGMQLSITLLPAIERAVLYRHCLDTFAAMGISHLGVVINPQDTNGGLLHAVSAQHPGYTIRQWLTIGQNNDSFPDAFTKPVPPPFTPPAHCRGKAKAAIDIELPMTAEGYNPSGPILFHLGTAYPFYVRHTMPVIRELVERGEKVVVALVPPAHPGILGDLADSVELRPITLVHTPWAQRVLRQLRPAIQERTRQFANAYPGVASLGACYGAHHPYFLRGMVEQLATMAELQELVAALCPRSCWLANSRDSGDDAMMLVAARNGISCLTGLAALVVDNIISAPFFNARTHWAAYGTALSELAIDRGYDEATFHLTGAPHFDGIYARKDHNRIRQEFRDRHHLRSSARVIGIFTSRANPAIENAWLPLLARWARDHGHVVLYKQHPEKSFRQYDQLEALIAEQGLTNVLWAEAGPIDSLIVSDICITDQSTMGIEAAILAKPMIQMWAANGAPVIDYNAEGIAPLVHNADELLKRLEAWGQGQGMPAEARASFLRRFNWGDDGKASSRVADLLVAPPVAKPMQAPPLLERLWGLAHRQGVRRSKLDNLRGEKQ